MTIRRLKTYAGSQGYVYQYYFVGKRPAASNAHESDANEYIFDVTSDRKVTYAVSVFFRTRLSPPGPNPTDAPSPIPSSTPP